jgi:hypothetical protein
MSSHMDANANHAPETVPVALALRDAHLRREVHDCVDVVHLQHMRHEVKGLYGALDKSEVSQP